MSFILLPAGLLVLGLSAFLLVRGLPKNGQVRSFAADGLTAELYTFAILIGVVVGLGLVLNAVL